MFHLLVKWTSREITVELSAAQLGSSLPRH
jgi:hypothetical protein